ncbi:MAG: hypothetical protein GXN96_00080 [Aquificae bacterium]|nr:hypothetical protein [Aquificota bacterium]
MLNDFYRVISSDWETTFKWSGIALLLFILSTVPVAGLLFLVLLNGFLVATALYFSREEYLPVNLKEILSYYPRALVFSGLELFLLLAVLFLSALPLLGFLGKLAVLFYLFTKPFLTYQLLREEPLRVFGKLLSKKSLSFLLSPYYFPYGFKWALAAMVVGFLTFLFFLSVVGVIVGIICLYYLFFLLGRYSYEVGSFVLPSYSRG